MPDARVCVYSHFRFGPLTLTLLVLLTMVAGAGLGRLENKLPLSLDAHDVDRDVLRLHDIAALAHGRDGLGRVRLETVPG